MLGSSIHRNDLPFLQSPYSEIANRCMGDRWIVGLQVRAVYASTFYTAIGKWSRIRFAWLGLIAYVLISLFIYLFILFFSFSYILIYLFLLLFFGYI